MPIYEYQCKSCGHQFEKLQKMSEDNLIDCPDCHKPELKKLISASSFQLKGSGWYASDFKNSSKKSTTTETPKPTPAAAAPKAPSGCASGGCGCH